MILAIFVEGHSRNISVNYFEIGPLACKEMLFKSFLLFLALAAILFSRAKRF